MVCVHAGYVTVVSAVDNCCLRAQQFEATAQLQLTKRPKFVVWRFRLASLLAVTIGRPTPTPIHVP